jgi:hypothetical protein
VTRPRSVELGAGADRKLGEGVLHEQGNAIGPVDRHGAVGVAEGDDPGDERDLFAGETSGIPTRKASGCSTACRGDE